MTHCNLCGKNFNAPKLTDDAYMAFLYHSMHFCPKCSIEIFERTDIFKNMNPEERAKYEEEKKRLEKTVYFNEPEYVGQK